MSHVAIPNVPGNDVQLVVVDGRISRTIEVSLSKLGINFIKAREYPGVYDAISCHPDIMLHHLGDEYIVHAPSVHPETLNSLVQSGFKLIPGATPLSFEYPGNIAYNAARVGGFVFHNLKHMDPVLRDELQKRGIELVHVKQGYAKCSVSVVSENCIITADNGIAGAAGGKGIEVLLIKPEENIMLPGLKNGFIGGSTGLIGRDKWAVSGNVWSLRSAPVISDFLESKKIEIISLSDEQVVDIGSIIPLLCK